MTEKELVENKGNKIYNEDNIRLKRIWRGMKERCNYPKHKSYKNYGGRGITVCDLWGSDFESFYQWAIKNGYKKRNDNR